MEFPGGNFHRMIPEQGCYDSESWKLSVPPRSNVTRYVPVFPDPATVDGGLRGGDPGVAEGEYRVFVRFQEQVLDRPNFIVSVQSEPVELPDDLSAGTTAFWAFPELELAERNASWDAYNGWVALFKVGCLIVPHCIDPLVLIPELDDPFASMRQAFMTAARADIDIVDTAHNQTRVKTEWINRTVYQEVCAPNNLGRNCPSLPHMIWFDRATARLHITTPATAAFPTIQDPKPWMSIETYEQDGLKHTLATWRVYGVDKRIRWNHPYEEEIRINHSADIDVLFGVSLEMGPYRGAPYVDPDGGVIDHSAWRSNPADSYWLTISGDTDSLQAEGTGIQGVNASGLVVGECASRGISVDVQAPSAGTYYLRVFNDNLLPPLDWDWETGESPARALSPGDQSTFYFDVCPDTPDEVFEFWLYRQSWVPGVFLVVDKVSQRVTATPPAGEFASVSAGGRHTCGVRRDGSVACWGSNEYGQATPLAGEFASLSAGSNHTCGVRRDGTVICWGDDDYGQATPPAGEFASVSAGDYHTCGVLWDGSVACWGRNTVWYSDEVVGQATPPAGKFASVSAGDYHTCGVQRDGTVACWGYAEYGQATPPAREFASVSAGFRHTCGVRRDGSVVCWGSNEYGQATPLAGEFASLSAGSNHTCGVRRDGTVVCWGDDDYGQATPPAGEFASVSAENYHTCGVQRDGTVACWGNDSSGKATPPAGEFASVSAGRSYTCGVRLDGSVACWGNDSSGKATPPAGEFASVSAGWYNTCGVRTDGSVACWGYDWSGRVTAPAGEFTSFSVGDYQACGVKVDGSVACWDDGENSETMPPAGEFASVSAGKAHICGLKVNGAVACWGDDDEGQATPPAGEFASVDAGWGHTCGLRTDGSVACWGFNEYGEATPPAGEFASVSAGRSYTCGVRLDGSVACWGFDEYDEATPPAGEFASVSAGYLHTCGLKVDGTVACWGDQVRGLTAADFE